MGCLVNLPHRAVVAHRSALETLWVLCDHVVKEESRMWNYLLEKVPWVFIQIYAEAFGFKADPQRNTLHG